jgi:hypothetical protein
MLIFYVMGEMTQTSSQTPSVVFTSLAMNQTLFFRMVGDELKKMGITPYYICFHDRSHELLLSKGERSFSIFDFQRAHPIANNEVEESFEKICKKHKFPGDRNFLIHEKVTFNLKDTFALKKKIFYYTSALEEIFGSIPTAKPLVVQELGGFTSLVSTYYVSRSLGFDHHFLEPSFFKGRYFSILNSFESKDIYKLATQVQTQVRDYLDKTLSEKRIVIPSKDTHHYWGLRKKIINFYNLKRFVQKVLDKYLLRKKEEFSYIFSFTWRHLKMFFKKSYFQRYYSEIPQKPFIYYPLHVPMDAALTLRSPSCLDQYSLIEEIARAIPADYLLCFKEHPAMVGVIDLQRTKDLMEKNSNIVFLDPSINNYEVLDKTSLIVTVNSKTGAEALLKQKRVIVMGDAFYRNCPLLHKIKDRKNLAAEIAETLKSAAPHKDDVFKYFQSVWDATYSGEIYSTELEHVRGFCEPIANYFKNSPSALNESEKSSA